MGATQTEWNSPEGTSPPLTLARPSRSFPVGEGWAWIPQGWKLFTRAPFMWILATLILFIAYLVFAIVPFGTLVFDVLSAAIGAGFVVACRSLEQGADFELEHLFAGFRTRFGSLVVVGAVVTVGSVAIALACAAIVGFSVFVPLATAINSGDPHTIWTSVVGASTTMALAVLVALALLLPLIAAYWFAPALIIMNGLGPGEAMKQSLVGCIRNFVPFLWYGVVMLVFSIIAAIPVFLGYFVLVPLMITSTYAAYRRIFTQDDAGGAPATA